MPSLEREALKPSRPPPGKLLRASATADYPRCPELWGVARFGEYPQRPPRKAALRAQAARKRS